MTRLAAKVLSRAGIAMVMLCIACRFVIRTESGMMGDNMAIIASGALTVAALVYLRIGPHDQADRARAAANAGTPGERVVRK